MGGSPAAGIHPLWDSPRPKGCGFVYRQLMDDPLSLFILAIFCNILIYIAVENYNCNPQEVGRYLAMFLGVVVFIFCGFEHCVADMFYFSLADVWNDRTILAC